MKKTNVKMNKSVYLGLSILDISKTLMYEFWCDYIKPKYQDNAKLCYMETESFLLHIKTEDFYKDIANDVKKWFNTSNYYVDRPLPKGMNKKVIGLMKEELCGNSIIGFVALRPKTYSYLTDDDTVHKKAKGRRKYVIKRILKFDDYKNCLFKNEIILKSQRFKSKAHCVCTEQIYKIALSGNDDKRLQTFDRITTYPYGTNTFKVCESELLSKYKWSILMTM